MNGLTSYFEACPNCGGLLDINLSWPGLPKWTFLEDGSLDEPFICPWCHSICRVGPESIISIEQQNNQSHKITADSVFFIKADYLSVLLCRLLYNQVNNRHEDQFRIGGNFNSEEEVMRWCANVISPIYKTNKLIRLPVLSI